MSAESRPSTNAAGPSCESAPDSPRIRAWALWPLDDEPGGVHRGGGDREVHPGRLGAQRRQLQPRDAAPRREGAVGALEAAPPPAGIGHLQVVEALRRAGRDDGGERAGALQRQPPPAQAPRARACPRRRSARLEAAVEARCRRPRSRCARGQLELPRGSPGPRARPMAEGRLHRGAARARRGSAPSMSQPGRAGCGQPPYGTEAPHQNTLSAIAGFQPQPAALQLEGLRAHGAQA
jgi:hypothetical protein